MKLGIALVMLAACGSSKPDPQPPKRPNNELIIGEFERHHPTAKLAARFRADGSVTIGADKTKLDSGTMAAGSWKLDGDQLTLSYASGICAGEGDGVYKVVISRVGIRFTKVDDSCAQRAKIDGETWFRIR